MRGRKVRKHQRQNKDIREERMKGIRDKATSFLKGAACCISQSLLWSFKTNCNALYGAAVSNVRTGEVLLRQAL